MLLVVVTVPRLSCSEESSIATDQRVCDGCTGRSFTSNWSPTYSDIGRPLVDPALMIPHATTAASVLSAGMRRARAPYHHLPMGVTN